MDRHGELSNVPVPRVLVHVDVFAPLREQQDEPSNTLLDKVRRAVGLERHREPERVFDTFVLAALWRYAQRNSVVLEAFADQHLAGMTQADLDTLMERLDALQAHPLRTGTVYPTLQVLVTHLPYRQDLVGVIDLPERGLRYGSWWVDVRSI